MPVLDLGPDGYRVTGSKPVVFRRGWRKWLYFARHPILAFVTYQIAYADDPEDAKAYKARAMNAIAFGVGTFLLRKFTGTS
jgi:hypothetical protein